MPIPIQIINNDIRSNKLCNGFSGNLNMFDFGLNNAHRQKLTNEWNTVGLLSTIDNFKSPYFTQVRSNEAHLKSIMEMARGPNCT